MVGLGFFAPLPLAMMMPFMAGQSMLMGDAFGKSYQYGKRRISAMSNEEFNKLTPEMLGKEIAADFNVIIPSLEEAMKRSTQFQRLIIEEMGNMIKDIPNYILDFFEGGTTQTSGTQQIRFGSQGGRDQRDLDNTRDRVLSDIETLASIAKKTGKAIFNYQGKTYNTDDWFKKPVITPTREPFVRKPIPVQPHTFKKLVSGLSLVEINSNIANYRAKLKVVSSPTHPTLVAYRAAKARGIPDSSNPHRAALNKLSILSRKYKSLLLDWLKKAQNYQTLLRNR